MKLLHLTWAGEWISPSWCVLPITLTDWEREKTSAEPFTACVSEESAYVTDAIRSIKRTCGSVYEHSGAIRQRLPVNSTKTHTFLHARTHTHTGLMGGFSARQSSGSTSVLLLHGELLLQSLPELPLSEQLHLQLCLLQLHLLLLSPRVVNRHFEQALRAHTHTLRDISSHTLHSELRTSWCFCFDWL